MKRLSVLLASVVCLAMAPAFAQDKYPSKPIKVIVPYAPGGATDIVARVVGEQMKQALGQSFVVENKPGAFGILAIEDMARAKPDGYTLMIGNVTTNAITPVLVPKKFSINYEKDVVPVARIADIPAFLLATAQDFPPKTMKEFVDYAKQNKGKVRYGSAGVGSYPHFDMVVLAQKAGLDMIHIPVKAGASGLINDMVKGDIQVTFLNVASSAAMIKAGKLRPLGVITEKRLAEYPDVPTLAEQGYPGIGTVAWQGLFAPAGTPKEVLNALHKGVVDALGSGPVQEAFKRTIFRAVPTASPEDAKTWLKDDMAMWAKIVAATKIELTD